MKVFRWDNDKNELLKNNRGVCFEQVVVLMEREDVLETVEHPRNGNWGHIPYYLTKEQQ